MLESILMKQQAFRLFRLVIFATLAGVGLGLVGGCRGTQTPPQLTPAASTGTATPTLNAQQLQTQIAYGNTPTPQPSATPWPIEAPTEANLLALNAAEVLNPLTGEPPSDEALLQQRPILVKIANWPQLLRPEVGLTEADIVFEYYLGFQMNHLAALYYGGNAPTVGPLAPGRLIDARLAEHYQANLAYDSAENMIEGVFNSVLPGRKLSRDFTRCPAICTETDALGGNTMVDTSALREHIAGLGTEEFVPALEGMQFDAKASAWDENAERLSYMYADFSVMDWRYDEAEGRYMLWQDYQDPTGIITLAQTRDRDTQEAVGFDNVIILFSHYITYGPELFDIDMREGDPEQRALLLRDGRMYFGTWQSSGPDQPFTFFGMDGSPLKLKPGSTWMTFASVTTRTKQVSPGNWDLTFVLN